MINKVNLLYPSLLFILIGMSVTSCMKEEDKMTPRSACDTSNTEFKQLFTSLTNTQGVSEEVFMDLETHEYDFEVSSAATVCQIGYQSLPNFNSTPYLIEIFNNTSQQLVYTGSHVFGSTGTDYVSITPTALVPGEKYTIRRIQTQWNGNIGNTIGRLAYVQGAQLSFPKSQGILSITGSNMYGTGGPAVDFGLPYIELVFQ